MLFEMLRAILYGIVEGITEWLPVSSTGHLIILDAIPALEIGTSLPAELRAEFCEMFEVVIQLGAILAVVVFFFGRLYPFSLGKHPKSREDTRRSLLLWAKIAVSCIPAAVFGLVADSILERLTGKDLNALLYTPAVVSAALMVYGLLFIFIERARRGHTPVTADTDSISFPQALVIGIFQALAIIPGTSRSGSTVLGGCCLGISRPAAAEFSFFMAIPTMLGASLLKCVGFVGYLSASGAVLPAAELAALATAFVTAFAVSLAVVRFLLDFVRRHTFSVFGVYRILLGIAVAIWFGLKNE